MSYTKGHIQAALAKSWTKQTSHNAEEWSPINPARGQCAISALIVQEILGGDLQKVRTVYNGAEEGHFRNLVDGKVIDTTRSQYPEKQIFEQVDINLKGFANAREKLLADEDTHRRYMILRKHVLELL